MPEPTTRRSRRLSLAVALACLASPLSAQVVEEAHAWGATINDHLGWSIALSGQTAAVAGPGRHDNSLGDIAIHRRGGGSWIETQLVVGSAADKDTWFACDLALEGDVLAAGDWADSAGDPGQPGFQRGAAYVFRRPDGASPFAEEAYLVPGDLVSHDRFGWALALSGDVLAVSAVGDDDGGQESGAVYVFRHAAGSWTQEARLVAPAAAAHERFGWSLALDGDTLVVGADGSHAGAPDGGAAFVFTHAAGSWSLQATLTAAAPVRGERFGAALDLQGDQLAVGVPGRTVTDLPGAGAVEVWQRVGGSWSRETTLSDTAPAGFSNLGDTLALDDDRLLVGAPLADDAGSQSGRALLFVRDGGAWTVSGTLAPSLGDVNHTLGVGLDLDGPLAAVGAPRARNQSTLGLGLTTFFAGLPGATP